MHKIVVHTYLLLVQHLFKAADDKFFQFITRRYITSVLQCWFWQPSPIHLAVECQGQCVYLHKCRRHHIFGQRAAQELAQLVDIDHRIAVRRVVEAQCLSVPYGPDDSHRLADALELLGATLYLAQLDAEAT